MRRLVRVPGCGFGFWYAWGVLDARDARDDVYAGASGGALAAAVHLCGCDVEAQLALCASLRARMHRQMCRGRVADFFATVRTWLLTALPEDAHERCRGRL